MNYPEHIRKLLAQTVQLGASDLHISAGRPPMVRVASVLSALEGEEMLTPENAQGLIGELVSPALQERFLHERQLDFAYALDTTARFRVNAYFQRGTWSAALRLVPTTIRSIEELGLPTVLHEFAKLSQGFVLMVGPAGHGKSTTTAALLDEMSRTKMVHIVTIEDPVEYLFSQGQGVVSQREVGSDVISFSDGLKSVLRQDPDVIMVGEMRDAESISAAMTAAETGHLVFSTLHTNSAAQTIDRIIDSFPATQQQQVISQVAATLVAIVSQRLVPRIEGGLVPALEIMIMNPAIRNLIRERKIFSIDSVIQSGMKEGMMTLDTSLANLVKQKQISIETAQQYAINPAGLKKLL